MRNMRNSGTLKRILRYLGNNRKLVPVSLGLALVQVVISLCIPVITGEAVDYAVSKGNVDFHSIVACLVRIGVCVIIGAVCEWVMEAANNKLSLNVSC